MFIKDFRCLGMDKAEQTRAFYVDQLLSFWMSVNSPNYPENPAIGTDKRYTLCVCRAGVWQDRPLYGLIDDTNTRRTDKLLRPLDEYIRSATKTLGGVEQGLWNLALSKPVCDWAHTLKFKTLDAEASFVTDIPATTAINAPGGIVTVHNVCLGDDISIELAEHGFTRFNWTDYMLFL